MNFAMTRAFPTKEHHLFYDSGSLSTSATLVSFHTYPAVPASPLIGKSSKYTPAKVNTTHVEVLGLGFDDTLGGQRLDALIKGMLVAEFEAKLGRPMEDGDDETFKALGKIGKEAARVKAILSANADAAVGVRLSPALARHGPT
jgi:hypoxia up-regulated 1